jgi:hypothetical protein
MRLAKVERQTRSTGVSAVATVGFTERDVAIVQARVPGLRGTGSRAGAR